MALNVGDWALDRSNSCVGYIGEIAGSYYNFIPVRDVMGNVVETDISLWISREELFRLNDSKRNKSEVVSLIDMALQTKDEKWFYELTELWIKLERCGQVDKI